MSEYVVLGATQMGNDRWCSIILNRTTGAKKRVNFPYPTYLSASLIRKGGGNPDLWQPGYVVDLMLSRNRARPRLTHPEDTNFRIKPIITTGQMVNLGQFIRNQGLLVAQPDDLFGTAIVLEKNCAVVPANTRVTTSCGLAEATVFMFRDNFGKLRASINIGGSWLINIPVTSLNITQGMEQRNLQGIVALGLANPYRPPSWSEGPKFCFVQLNGFVI